MTKWFGCNTRIYTPTVGIWKKTNASPQVRWIFNVRVRTKTSVISSLYCLTLALCEPNFITFQGRSQDFSKGGGSHCVKHYRHGVFATEYYRLFS